ncbi:hypothetical protein C6988_03920 [Nitrosopumilus sp. b1]|uniref:DUF7508 domain-containing protein n=1 Tax=Nitrosopumilus sp. b1 TaxID=2109907 RepID=UPI000E2CC695|nr:hypothetical protein [Nitrosopumilus sp. b1]RDJ30894.1 MAG: hypothetical protein DWQ17_07880 [Thermoproteota archaeon]KAF6243399.1 hypothetical protein C6988_03920 [Nitrosopumilus sp. b1]RDJ34292.1 MAG: hypothetical protein DWQ18_05250 [Thermoproteota archaeon]RDJ36596.1 MAG: hypothetical protein DWQ13_05360 [Thermoproteota archaeon]RDJ37875.1 MAG: hypothetical protein DWQ19_05475 [Thermoproteota archaeon]
MSESISWSDWLDYNSETINKSPTKPGVFMMHAAMKILLIQGTENIRKELADTLSNDCTAQATRFRYTISEQYQKIYQELIQDYKNRHEGKLPKCME